MHDAAMSWVRAHAPVGARSVLDIGGRDVNGTPRGLFAESEAYRVLDVLDGVGVDVVADAAFWVPDAAYDVVVCTEVFEHTAAWRDILHTAYAALRSGGVLVATMAGPSRAPHSAIDGGPVGAGEYYANIDPAQLLRALGALGFDEVVVDAPGSDVRCRAVRP